MFKPRPIWILLAPLLACASTGGESESPLEGAQERMQVEGYAQEALREKTTLGMALAQLDRSIQAWNQLFLNGSEATDGRRLRNLQDSITHRTRKLFYEIVDQLETGPPINRRIAATALGFAANEESLSPLLNALSDSDDEVVANALLGLSLLGDPDTPTSSLAGLIQSGTTPTIRSNAALATLEVLRSGASAAESVLPSARSGLHDQDPRVRTQCALILAHRMDVASIGDLSLAMLEDPVPSAAMAATRALAYMGSNDNRQKGRVARIMTAGLSRLEGGRRDSLLNDLRKLAGRNYAKDEDWVTWAHRLPPGE